MKYAIIRDGLVEQIILWDGANDWRPPAGTVTAPCDDTVRIGSLFDGKSFTAPAQKIGAPDQAEAIGSDNLTDSERATFKALAAKIAQ